MHRLVLKTYNPDTMTAQVEGEEAFYLYKVLRLQTGAELDAITEDGTTFDARLITISSKEGVVSLSKKDTKIDAGSVCPITLFQCLPKGQKMDTIIRQAVEAGVSRIVPLESEFSIAKADKADDSKKSRYERIIKEALQQSGSAYITKIENPIPFASILEYYKPNSTKLGLYFHEKPLAKTHLHEYLSHDFDEIAMVVGPEGGLSVKETRLLSENGFGSVYLGNSILRTETASIFALGAIRIILLEKASWKKTNQTP